MGRFCTISIAAFATLISTAARADDLVDFARDIQPVLARRCYECHAQKQTAGLRLDRRSSALRGGESETPSIVPSKPDESELLKRVESKVDGERMPPEGEPLTADEIAKIRNWIAAGAVWPDKLAGESAAATHWAFQSPHKPAPPSVKNEQWSQNEIDRFILAGLEQEGLTPSAEADRITLIRRLSLDLIGLPPTIEEVDAFVADNSPDAYTRLVNRLLDSPHYGERWGRHWLDAARYADSDGYEKDKPRFVWFFRDWVIGALNRDLPYDQFVIEQIAGDLLPNATQDQIVATGFLRNSMLNEEGGIDPEQFRMEAMFDRMDAIGKSMLGLTIQCAQCHDHKFDPITQEDYYRLFAFLNNDHEANIAAYAPSELQQRAEIFEQIREIEDGLQHQLPDWAERMAAWENEVRDNQPTWHVIKPFSEDLETGGQKHLPLQDGSLLAQGYAPTRHTAAFRANVELPNITAVRLELLNDPNLPRRGPGRSIKGTSALTEFEVTYSSGNENGKAKVVRATADLNLPEAPLDAIYDDKSGKRRVTGPIEYAIDGEMLTAWGTEADPGRRNLPRKAVFNLEKPIANPAGTVITFHLRQMHGGWNSDDNQNHNLGRFRISVTDAPDVSVDPVPTGVREIFAIPREQRSPEQVRAIFSHWRTTVAEWAEANQRIEELWKKHPEGATQLALASRAEGRTTSMLRRGDFLKPMKAVTAGTPSFLHALPENTEPTRLTFAKWLVDRNSPTTARSFVNRVWQAYFGIGLVSTSEDLGMQAEAPSHPELLDWLAVEFMDRGWSLKELHRLIVHSATYRQSSAVTPELVSRDPYNRLLARGSRTRVEAEVVRDVALAASGLLNREIGGPSVYPPVPAFMFQPPVSYGPKIWREDQGPNRYRRGLYAFRYRSLPYPVFQNFDAPNGDFSCVRRVRSNTPLQALTTLNEPIFVECAQSLALNTIKQGGTSDADRIAYAFRRCVSRPASDEEANTLQALLAEQREHFAQADSQPAAVAFRDPAKSAELPDGVTPAELASWTVVARVLLNLDETITKE